MSAMNPYLSSLNLNYVEDLLSHYRREPEALDPSWRYFFDGMTFAGEFQATGAMPAVTADFEFELKVIELIHAHREMAYLIADVNPLDRSPKTHPLLELKRFGLKDSDLDRSAHASRLLGMESAPVKEIIATLRACYTGPAAVELGHIEDPKTRLWVQKRIEERHLLKPLDAKTKLRIWEKLAEADSLEQFLHKRFVGQKRFSAEGCDVFTPMMDFLVDHAANLGADEIILGMAHRGRLSVLANIYHMDLKVLFAHFSGNVGADITADDGDVTYHIGASEDTTTFSGKNMHISLVPNPSHLEAVNPVVMGMTHAKQKQKKDLSCDLTWPVLIHGDASFSGQGIIYETFNMSNLTGYTTGGTIHILINNQVGFTANPDETRSTDNPTDLAKMLQIPIFRVNADEPEAVLHTVELAAQFRHEFKQDVIIELLGYRRHGHNEGDEPEFTQPVLYNKIKNHPTILQQYTERLKQTGILTDQDIDSYHQKLADKYEQALDDARKSQHSSKLHMFGKKWKGLRGVPQNESIFDPIKTEVSEKILQNLGQQIAALPADFHLHRKLKRVFEERSNMMAGKKPLDWGMGEALGFASIINDGYRVRIAGQDAKRGTFSHRHAVLVDTENGENYSPLNHLKGHEGGFEAINSLLSEYGAMGFEFGESLSAPEQLTIWEAQFGDFANGAQIIIDQFIAGSASKWQRYSGLTLLLPHGIEGQGPEHSSSRLERFLQMCAQHNMQVCNLTTPAQIFHALRRQILRPYRLPLIAMTPKSTLRHPLAGSTLDDFTKAGFREIIDEASADLRQDAKRAILCNGKIYYELLQERENLKDKTPLIRIEQFYPFPKKQLSRVLDGYKKLEELVWCQEEPENMGGWLFMLLKLQKHFARLPKLSYAGRTAQPSPSNGYAHLHTRQQLHLVRQALTGKKS